MKKSLNKKQKLAKLAEVVGSIILDGEGPFPMLKQKKLDYADPSELDAAICKLQVKQYIRESMPCDLPAELEGQGTSHVYVREASPGVRFRVFVMPEGVQWRN